MVSSRVWDKKSENSCPHGPNDLSPSVQTFLAVWHGRYCGLGCNLGNSGSHYCKAFHWLIILVQVLACLNCPLHSILTSYLIICADTTLHSRHKLCWDILFLLCTILGCNSQRCRSGSSDPPPLGFPVRDDMMWSGSSHFQPLSSARSS